MSTTLNASGIKFPDLTTQTTAAITGPTTSTVLNAANGWEIAPTGIMRQWGTAAVVINTPLTITFPHAFSTAAYAVNITTVLNVVASSTVLSGSPSVTDFQCVNNTTSTNIYWTAVGN